MTDETKTENVPATTEKPKPQLVASMGAKGAILPENIEQAFRLAQVISLAKMAPASYKDDENKIMVGILHGMEVGLTPMAALQSIAVINGMPTIWGDGALGLIEASGLLEDKKEWIERDDKGAIVAAHCWMKRRGRKEPIEQSFTFHDANEAGLLNKQGPWQQYRRRMYQMRARSWSMRDGFSDVLRGLGIAEEVRDMEEGGALASPPTPRPTRADFEPKAAEAEDAVADKSDGAAAKATIYDLVDETGTIEHSYTAVYWPEKYLEALAAQRFRDEAQTFIDNNGDTVSLLGKAGLLPRNWNEEFTAAQKAVQERDPQPEQGELVS